MATVRLIAWILFGIWVVLLGGFEIRMLRRASRGQALGRAGGYKYIPLLLGGQLALGIASSIQRGLLLTAVFAAAVASPVWTVATVIRAVRLRNTRFRHPV